MLSGPILSWAPVSRTAPSGKTGIGFCNRTCCIDPEHLNDHPPASRRSARSPRYKGAVAIDTETMGLEPHARPALRGAALARRRLGRCGADRGGADARPISRRCWPTRRPLKIFHFARFDIGVLFNAFGVMPAPVYCTKIASRLTRTYTDKHGLKDLVREVLGVDLSKQQQSSDWGAEELDRCPGRLCRLRRAAPARAARTSSTPCWRARAAAHLAEACFRFLPDRVRLDLAGWAAEDIFAHSA